MQGKYKRFIGIGLNAVFIELGVRKLNVNTELRNAYLGSLRDSLSLNTPDITNVMDNAVEAMTSVVVKKIRQFAGR